MKILYIDWDDKTRDYVSMVLEMGMDAEVCEAASLGDAITIFEIEEDFDLFICEAELKKDKAIDFLKFLKENKIYKPVIWLSDIKNKDKSLVTDTMNSSESYFFVPKPFKDDEFFPIVEKALTIQSDENMFNLKPQSTEGFDQEDWDKATKKDDEADWSLLMEKNKKETNEISVNEDSVASDLNGLEEASGNLSRPNADLDEKKNEFISELKKEKAVREKIKLKKNEDPVDLSKWRKIKAKRLLSFNPVQADIYIRLKSDKYLKLIHKQDSYEHSRINSYLDKGIFYFYVPVEQYRDFLGQFEEAVFKGLDQAQNQNSKVKSVIELACYDNIISNCIEWGISEKMSGRINKTIQSVIKTIDKKSSLFEILQGISKGSGYISQHSLMLSYICCEIVKGTPWGGHSSIEKLSLAAMLHDSCFSDDDLAKEHDRESDLNNYEKDAQDVIKSHMGDAAKLLSQAKGLYPDVDSIIMQHHERPDGSGYPRGLAGNVISPMSAVFIISEDLTQALFKKNKTEVDIDGLTNRITEYYNRGNFKKPLEAAKKFLKKVD